MRISLQIWYSKSTGEGIVLPLLPTPGHVSGTLFGTSLESQFRPAKKKVSLPQNKGKTVLVCHTAFLVLCKRINRKTYAHQQSLVRLFGLEMHPTSDSDNWARVEDRGRKEGRL